MTARARLVLRYASPADARTVLDAVRLENEAYVATSVEARDVVAEATAEDAGSLLHTLDDLLACVSAAESVIDVGDGSGRD